LFSHAEAPEPVPAPVPPQAARHVLFSATSAAPSKGPRG
jgi:hypothetical protein